MGAPKQKWTNEEEAALRAGVEKYGPGKWRAILKDPLLSTRLASRSNVDLKDKWRNMSVTANGWGSREKARLALKRSKHLAKQSGRHLVLSSLGNGSVDEMNVVAKPVSAMNEYMHSSTIKRSTLRLEKLILDAISSFRDPNGSSKSTIASYIEENYSAPPNFRRLLSAKLRSLASCGRLMKIRQNFKLPGSYAIGTVDVAKAEKAKQAVARITNCSSKNEDQFTTACKTTCDTGETKPKKMTAAEAAKAAALAVVDAEVAAAAAEQAALEAEAAEAEAVAAELFAEAAKAILMASNTSKNCQ